MSCRPSGSSVAAVSVPRVVPDTNIYVSALIFAGVADHVLALGRAGDISLFTSQPILDETQRVLIRKFAWSTDRAHEAIDAIRTFSVLVHPRESLAVIEQDEADNRILECAVAASATVIVTGDGHLLRLRQFRDIPITRPRDFLRSLTAP